MQFFIVKNFIVTNIHRIFWYLSISLRRGICWYRRDVGLLRQLRRAITADRKSDKIWNLKTN